MPVAVVAVLVALFLFAGQGNPFEGALTILNTITRGKRLTHSPADETGYVAADVDELVEQSGASSADAYAAARMIASEEGGSDNATKAAVCWCLINKSNNSGRSIVRTLTRAKNPRNDGRFGSQRDKDPTSPNYKGSDRYASTATDPYAGELEIAEGCLDGSIVDITGGCTNYDRPAGEENPDQVAADRVADGLTLVDVPGASSGLRFWRPV